MIQLIERQQLLCCSAQLWAGLFGWFQAVAHSLLFVFYCVSWVPFLERVLQSPPGTVDEVPNDTSSLILGAGLLFLTVISILGLIAGIILILGIKQQSQTKLKIWIALQIISLGLSAGDLFVGLYLGHQDIFVILIIRDSILISSSMYGLLVVSLSLVEIMRGYENTASASAWFARRRNIIQSIQRDSAENGGKVNILSDTDTESNS